MKPAKLLALLLTVICISLILTPTMTEARQKSCTYVKHRYSSDRRQSSFRNKRLKLLFSFSFRNPRRGRVCCLWVSARRSVWVYITKS